MKAHHKFLFNHFFSITVSIKLDEPFDQVHNHTAARIFLLLRSQITEGKLLCPVLEIIHNFISIQNIRFTHNIIFRFKCQCLL